MTDYIGVSMKEIIRAFGDDYVIKDGFEGTNYFICYEESVCPFDIGICYFSDNFENIDGMDIVNCVWSTIDDGTMSINGDITTDITYKEVKELTGSELSWNGDDDSYVSVYEDENGYIIRFYWESEKPADNEKAFSVLVYAKAG